MTQLLPLVFVTPATSKKNPPQSPRSAALAISTIPDAPDAHCKPPALRHLRISSHRQSRSLARAAIHFSRPAFPARLECVYANRQSLAVFALAALPSLPPSIEMQPCV